MAARTLGSLGRRKVLFAAAIGAAGLFSRPAFAETWIAPGDGNWNTGGNWDTNNPPVSGTTTPLIFNASGVVSYTATNDIGAFTLNSITFNNTGTGLITVAGANLLTFGGTTPGITVTGAAAVTSPIGGTAGLRKLGTGTLTLSGDSTYTGTTTVSAGTLIYAGNPVGSGTTAAGGFVNGTITSSAVGRGTLSISGGATFSVAGANRTLINTMTIAGTAANPSIIDIPAGLELTNTGTLNGGANAVVVKNGPGIWRLTTGSTTTASSVGTMIINAGNVILTDASVDTVAGGGDLGATNITVNNTGTFTLGQFAGENPDLPDTTIVTVNTGGHVAWTIGEQFGAINLLGGSLAVGGNVTMNAASADWRAGTVTRTAGAFGGAAVVNKTTSGTVMITGAAMNSTGGLNIMDGVISTNAAIVATGNLTFGTNGAGATTGTLQYRGGTTALAKPIVLNDGGGVIDVSTAATVYSLSGGATGAGPLTKVGPGTLAITGADTHAGLTTVTAGTLQVGGGATVGSTTANIAVGAGAIVAFNRSDAASYAGNISGAGEVRKLATNVTTLSGSLTYTGATTVSAGTLRVTPQSLAGALTVAEGATFSMLNGPIAATTTVPSANLQFTATGATLRFELSSATNPTVPLLNVTTPDGINLNAGGHTLAVSSSQSLAVGTFTLIQYAGADIASGFTLAPLPARTLGTLQFDTANKQIDLDITSVDSTRWRGDLSSNWDVGSAVNVGGTNNWRLQSDGTATNFVDGDVVTFDDTATAGSYTVNVTGPVQPSRITVNNTANNYTFSGTGPITGSGNLIKQGTGSLTILVDSTSTGTTTVSAGTLIVGNGGTAGSLGSGDIVNNGAITVNRSDPVTFSGAVSGTGSLTKLGAANLTVVGAYTIAGDTTLAGGTLVLGTGPGFTYPGKITGAGGLTKVAAGPLVLGGLADYTGPTTVSTAGSLVFAGGATLSGAIGLTLGTSNVNFNSAGASTVSGIISGLGTVTQSGAGTTTLTGVNTYTGLTTVSGGTLEIGGAGVIPGNISVGAAGTLAFNQSADATYSVVLSGTGTINKLGTNTLTLDGGSTFTGTLNVNAGTVIVVDNNGGGDFDASSIIVNNAARFVIGIGSGTNNPDLTGTAVITINPGGIAEFQVGEDYGGINLKGGEYRTSVNSNFTTAVTSILESGTIVNTGAAAALGTNGNGTFRKTTAGTVTLTGVPFLVNLLAIEDGVFSTDSGLSAGGSLTFGTNGAGATGGTLRYRGPTGSLAKPIVVNTGGGTVEITNAATAIQLTGVISGVGPVTKTGPGAVVFTGNNTYSGTTTVSAGTLLANNTAGSGTGTGPLSVGAAGTFGGTGSIASALALAGTLTPGSAGVGILTSASTATFQAASFFAVELGDVDTGDALPPVAGTDYDQLALTGTGTTATLVSGARLSVTVLPGVVDGQQFTILDNQNGGTLTGIFADAGGAPLPDGAIFTAGSRQFQITYPGGDVVLTAVPEPAAAGMLALVATGLLARRRRRAI